jgi:hypothetical protein
MKRESLLHAQTVAMLALVAGLLAATIGGCSGATGTEESGEALTLDQTYDMVRNGARLIMGYDAQRNSFVGTVENTTNSTLRRVRVEVHLSNGVELGPTTPVDLAPGEKVDVALPATDQAIDGWTPHAEVGPGAGGGAGEHGPGGEGGGEQGSGGERGGEHGSGEGGGEHGGGD